MHFYIVKKLVITGSEVTILSRVCHQLCQVGTPQCLQCSPDYPLTLAATLQWTRSDVSMHNILSCMMNVIHLRVYKIGRNAFTLHSAVSLYHNKAYGGPQQYFNELSIFQYSRSEFLSQSGIICHVLSIIKENPT